MDLPDDGPSFPKLPFLAGDALLIAVAFYIGVSSGTPLPPAAIYAIAGCVGLGAVLAAIPFIIDYNRRQDALLHERQEALSALVRTTAAASEQASIALGGLHQVVELAQKNLRAAEHLPQKLQEKLNEFNHSQDEGLTAEVEALQQEVNTLRASEAEKLETVAEKIHRALAELAKLEPELRRHPAAIEEAGRQAENRLVHALSTAMRELEQARRPLITVTHEPSAPGTAAESTKKPAAKSITAPDPASGHTTDSAVNAPATPAQVPDVIAVPVGDTSAAPVVTTASPPAAPSRKPAKRKPDHSTDFLPDFLAATPAGDAPTAAATVPEPAPVATRAEDGATRLTVTSYIGIGNKLFIRGDGPGLNWDRGVPLQFISIGKWRWEAAGNASPVRVKVFKNDQIACERLGEVQIEPGHHLEVSADF